MLEPSAGRSDLSNQQTNNSGRTGAVAARIGRIFARTFVRPVWVAGAPHVETWSCPACGRSIERRSPAVKGIWVTAMPSERTALCARQHGAHDRKGRVLAADEPQAVGGDDDVWIPLVVRGDGSCVALVPPAGLELVPVDGGRGYLVIALDELNPSDLVGHARTGGHELGVIARDAVRVDPAGRPIDVDARRLPCP
jgi:hypothetical protein